MKNNIFTPKIIDIILPGCEVKEYEDKADLDVVSTAYTEISKTSMITNSLKNGELHEKEEC